LWLYQPGEPTPEWAALCLPVLSLHPSCRFDWGQEYQLANACHPAGLDGNGALVSCPRGIRPRSQSGALAKVRRIAVESGHKPRPLGLGLLTIRCNKALVVAGAERYSPRIRQRCSQEVIPIL